MDVALRSWLEKRRAGQQTQPDPDAKTSCLRPARASTLRENPKTYKLACITNVCTLGHAFEPSCTQAHAPPAPRVSPEALP